jgi:hypothetical protein
MKTTKSVYRRIKNVWQILPPAWNDRIKQVPVLGQVLRLATRVTIKNASHEEIYDKRYYDFVDAMAGRSAPAMAATIGLLFVETDVVLHRGVR